jgi:hypothetical protein
MDDFNNRTSVLDATHVTIKYKDGGFDVKLEGMRGTISAMRCVTLDEANSAAETFVEMAKKATHIPIGIENK